MIAIKGKWSDGHRSSQICTVLSIQQNGRWRLVRFEDDKTVLEGSEFDWTISARLANIPRHLGYKEGSFETTDNDGVDGVLKLLQRNHWSLWVHLLESRMGYVFVALVFFAIFAFSGVKYGIPAAAKLIATHLPDAVLNQASEQTLAFFDKALLERSEIKPERERQLRRHLQPVIDDHPDLQLKIAFRKGGHVGPNAFALPNGQIIFTDEMVALAESDNELLAVLTHEVGHVIYHHGIRRLIQDSLLSFAILAVTGDASGVSELFLGLPVVLTELGYSRKFEQEADLYALHYLQSHAIAPRHFADIIGRISETNVEQKNGSEKSGKWRSFLSTHPASQERADLFLRD